VLVGLKIIIIKIIIIIIIVHRTICMMLLSWLRAAARVHPVH